MAKMPIAEYRKRQDGTATLFDVTAAKAPKFTTMIGMGIFCIVLGLGFMGSDGGLAFFAFLMGGFSLWYGWTRDIRPKGYKENMSFRVTPETIEANGRRFPKDDIHRLLIRNGISDQEVGVTQYDMSAAQASGLAYRAKVGTIANALTVESGGKSTILAGGMDGTTAFGLLSDVSKVIGFQHKDFSSRRACCGCTRSPSSPAASTRPSCTVARLAPP